MAAIDYLKYAGCGLLAATGIIYGADIVFNFFSEKIKSQSELEAVVNEETKKLGMKSNNILSTFHKKDDTDYYSFFGARSGIVGYDKESKAVTTYDDIDNANIIELKVLDIKEGSRATKQAVRHELYHLSRHLPIPEPKSKIKKFLKYFFYEEPAAILYATTGVKL